MSQVRATRNGETRTFNQEVWNAMPTDHYGWKASAEVPESVINLMNGGESGTQDPNPQDSDPKNGGESDPNPNPVGPTVKLEGQMQDNKIFPDPKVQEEKKSQDPHPQVKPGRNANSRK